MVNLQLSGRSLDNLFFDGSLGDESVDNDLLLLADAMGSIDCLQVNLWVPVAIKNNNDVRSVEVDAKAASACRQNKDLSIGLWVLEHVDSLLAIAG